MAHCKEMGLRVLSLWKCYDRNFSRVGTLSTTDSNLRRIALQ